MRGERSGRGGPGVAASSARHLLPLAQGNVLAEWIDYNGHMNVVHYRAVFEEATGALFDHLGLGRTNYISQANATMIVVEEHTRYRAELREGDGFRVLGYLAAHSERKLHYLFLLENGATGELSATHEEIALHVDLSRRKAAPLPVDALQRIAALRSLQADVPPHEDLGRTIGI